MFFTQRRPSPTINQEQLLILWVNIVSKFYLMSMQIAADPRHERIDIYLIGEATDAPQFETQRRAVLEMWRDLNKEDVGLIESLQKGRTSPAYDGGRLSPYWDEAPLHLSRMILEGMR